MASTTLCYEEVIHLLKTTLLGDEDRVRHILMDKMVENGKITPVTLNTILSNITELEKTRPEIIISMYQALEKIYKYPKSTNVFTQQQLQEAGFFKIKEFQSSFPLKFSNVIQLAPNEQYLIVLDAQEIAKLVENKVIKIRADMQRESHISIYNGEIVSHVEYNNKVSIAISKSIQNGTFFSNALRWHLVVDGTEDYHYNEENQNLLIRNGFIANIDGQHRSYGIVYACSEIEKPNLKIPVLFTIGNVSTAQNIIYQEEQRTPLKKDVVESYKSTATNQIARQILSDPDFLSTYKIVPNDNNPLLPWNAVAQDTLVYHINQIYTVTDSYIENRMLAENIKLTFLMLAPYAAKNLIDLPSLFTVQGMIALSKILEPYDLVGKQKQLSHIIAIAQENKQLFRDRKNASYTLLTVLQSLLEETL